MLAVDSVDLQKAGIDETYKLVWAPGMELMPPP